MRWLVLYVRSRRAAASTGIALAVAAAIGLPAAVSEAETTRLVLALFAVTSVVAVAATSLAGPDPGLDRTAALDWRLRRTAHVVAVGGLAAGAVASLGVVAADVVVRNAAGLTGLGALGVTVLGGGLAWCLPVAWTAVGVTVLFAVPEPGAPLLTWLVQPADSGTATVAACVLGVSGLVAYTLAGPSTHTQ
ncbi:hypothetical protein [Actinophytocola sp. KF-1]